MKKSNFGTTLISVCLYVLAILPLVGIGYAQDKAVSITSVGKVEEIEERLGEVENEVSIQKGYEQKLSEFKEYAEQQIKLARNEVDRICRTVQMAGITIAIVAGLAAILTFMGARRYLGIHRRLTETMDLYNIMEKSIDEKEKELHERLGEIVGKEKGKYTSIEQANFLDYEHKLYFVRLYLPITRNVMKHKKSLFVLGKYWLDQENFGRAFLRFEEIERLQEELDSKKNYLFRILKSINRKAVLEERILGKDTAKFFNLYGYTYSGLAEKSKDPKERENFLIQAEKHYKKAISIDPNYASPYYNLGRLYSYVQGKNELGLEWYKKVFGKTPDLSLQTYRNMACCMIRLMRRIEEIIEILKNIPDCNPYWQEIVDDEFIGPKIKATPKLRDFIKQKCTSINLPS